MERFSTIGEMPEDLSVLTQASIVMSPVPKLSPGASFAWTYWLIPLNERASRTLATVCSGPFWSTPFAPSTSSCAVVPESSSSGNPAGVSGGGPAGGTPHTNHVVRGVGGGVGGGAVTLVDTGPTPGCTTTLVKNVGPGPTCTPPPANMTAWFPLDELSGTTAQELVLGANGVDQNGPLHTVAKVRLARSFNGINQYVQANDAPGLNFGTGDITIDAWVSTLKSSGISPIVEKRSID